ncbi:hypothetical protein [Methyloceanibacter caenitepidi]|uniref:Uncharacterized protein n=1 Tax=Methyloceanibacter caenitepidi TaxID=1384459 RepID=A0A0A8K666_9HYPH|nr:hypothetical protein [Methyloceanibacter caenitepidi]BAQ18286.1 hypothetical protein GL4_2853 [Methyloceanibacter caenitepidi]
MDWVTSIILALGVVSVASIMAWTFVPKGWRTIAANVFAGGLVVVSPYVGELLQYLVGVPWASVYDKKTAFALTLAIGAMNALWRKYTNTPMGRKG